MRDCDEFVSEISLLFGLSEQISHTSSFRMINVCVVDVNGLRIVSHCIVMYDIDFAPQLLLIEHSDSDITS